MTKRILTGLAIFVAALIIFVVANFPAHYALKFLPAQVPIKLNSVQGTIWRGSAGELRVNNRSLGKLTWQLRALPLLLGKASASFEIHREGFNVVGSGSANYQQVLTLSDTSIDAEVERLPIPTDRLMAIPSGMISGFVTHALFSDNWIDEVNANFIWDPASLLSPIPMEFGNIALDLNGEDGNLEGDVTSSGALDTQGGFKISSEGRLTADIRITPTEETPAELLDILPMFGQPSRDGSVRLQQTFQLPGIAR